MKKRVKAKVINGDWEIRKYKTRKKLEEAKEAAKNGAKFCAGTFMYGAGFATVLIINFKLRDLF